MYMFSRIKAGTVDSAGYVPVRGIEQLDGDYAIADGIANLGHRDESDAAFVIWAASARAWILARKQPGVLKSARIPGGTVYAKLVRRVPASQNVMRAGRRTNPRFLLRVSKRRKPNPTADLTPKKTSDAERNRLRILAVYEKVKKKLPHYTVDLTAIDGRLLWLHRSGKSSSRFAVKADAVAWYRDLLYRALHEHGASGEWRMALVDRTGERAVTMAKYSYMNE